jgi:hypothetical protein
LNLEIIDIFALSALWKSLSSNTIRSEEFPAKIPIEEISLWIGGRSGTWEPDFRAEDYQAHIFPASFLS